VLLFVSMQISLEAKGPEAFHTPRGCCVPFGVMELALAALPYEQQDRYKQLLAASETAGLSELNSISEELQVSRSARYCCTGCAGLGLRELAGMQMGWCLCKQIALKALQAAAGCIRDSGAV
jgi:hypothetical protein